MALKKYKPLVVDPDGIYSMMPDGGLLGIAGTTSSSFMVGGKFVKLSDSADGSGDSTTSTLQQIYDNSLLSPVINLSPGGIEFSGTDGSVKIDGSGQLFVSGLNVGVSLSTALTQLANHTQSGKHPAKDITLDAVQSLIAANVQDAIEELAARAASDSVIKWHEHLQIDEMLTWTIHHNKNTVALQAVVYTVDDRQIFPDEVIIVDENTVEVTFKSAMNGRASLMLFLE